MDEHTDQPFALLFRREIDAAVGDIPRHASSIVDPDGRHKTRAAFRRRRWRYGAVAIALTSAVALVLSGLQLQDSPTTRVGAYHVAGWTLWVSSAAAATAPTAGDRVVRQSARAQYLSMAHRLRARGVYLGNDPVVLLAQLAHGATHVRFPSGAELSLSAISRDIWYVTVASRSDESDPARQVNMVFTQSGSLVRALPADQPAMLHTPSLRASDIANLSWQDVPTKTLELPNECTDSGCPPVTAVPHPDATLDLATAQTDAGDVVFNLNATNLAPNTVYFFETGAGITGSAQTGDSGTLVALITLAASDVKTAMNGPGNGVVELTGHGFEAIFACPFGGSVSIGASLASCG